MMGKMFVSDFDRTLYVDSAISETDLEAVRDWRSRGNLFVLATGRGEDAIREKLGQYALTTDHIICNNGARVVSWDGELLFQQHIPEAVSRKLSELLFRKYALPPDVVCAGRDVLQMHIRFPGREEAKEAADFVNRTASGVQAFANEWNLDIVKSGIHKASGLACLIEKTGWSGPVAVIGDSLNDLEMIRQFRGFTVEWAGPEVKQASRQVFKSVALCMEQLIP